jgi:catechol 2,3-dioxygenase-like lactoylglutathione lyase family enzyme
VATKIKHVAIRTTSKEKAQLMSDFYGELFGMTQNNRTSDGYVWASLGARGIARQAGPDHFGLEVDDVEEIMARSKASYPEVNFLKRPSTRPFAEIGTHDPAGNVFDLYQARPGSSTADAQPRHLRHLQLRAVNPAQLAKFYQDVYGLQIAPRADDESSYALTDGRVTLVIAQWSILDYGDTGVARPAIDHLGFEVESLEAFKQDLDELMESRPELFPPGKKDATEDARMLEILGANCHRGEMQLHDPDGWLLDVSEAK